MTPISKASETNILPSPVALGYLGALRGIKPRAHGAAFTYADIICINPEQLICLAASNPEGRFFGVVADDAGRASATSLAADRGVINISFIVGTPRSVNASLDQSAPLLPQLDYLYADESARKLSADERRALFELADRVLTLTGMFTYTYNSYDEPTGALKFLVREFGPEMTIDQARLFLEELKGMGDTVLSSHPDIAAKLDQAIATGMPDAFFDMFEQGEAKAGSFDTMLAMKLKSFAYLGDQDISQNYIELSLSPKAQKIIEQCTTHPLYEPLKDYALGRTRRSDVWCRLAAATQPASMPELFGGFVYGITIPREKVPASLTLPGVTLSFAAPVYKSLIDLLTVVPASIGDFLATPTGKNFKPVEIIGALQIMIACGIVQPMRGSNIATNLKDIAKPKLVGSFNRYLEKTPVTKAVTWMASPVIGSAVPVTARDALVIQALDRVGLANSVSALLPELERLAKNPAEASKIMTSDAPTKELAHQMIEDAVSESMVKWYAYGLLEAA